MKVGFFIDKPEPLKFSASELRIGNLVMGAQGPETVSAILNETDIELKGVQSTFVFGVCVDPILITPKWLKAFEFTPSGEWFGKYCYPHQISITISGGIKCTIGMNEEVEVENIKHVHQLQNLYFALTGKELELK